VQGARKRQTYLLADLSQEELLGVRRDGENWLFMLLHGARAMAHLRFLGLQAQTMRRLICFVRMMAVESSDLSPYWAVSIRPTAFCSSSHLFISFVCGLLC